MEAKPTLAKPRMVTIPIGTNKIDGAHTVPLIVLLAVRALLTMRQWIRFCEKRTMDRNSPTDSMPGEVLRGDYKDNGFQTTDQWNNSIKHEFSLL